MVLTCCLVRFLLCRVFQRPGYYSFCDVWNDGRGNGGVLQAIPSLTKYYMSELTLEMTKVMTKMMH